MLRVLDQADRSTLFDAKVIYDDSSKITTMGADSVIELTLSEGQLVTISCAGYLTSNFKIEGNSKEYTVLLQRDERK